jgi:hypothetical protein
MREIHNVLVGEPDRIGLLYRSSYRWEAIVKMDLKEIEK